MSGKNWQCPFCGSYNAPSNGKVANNSVVLGVSDGKFVNYKLNVYSRLCSNPSCAEVTVGIGLHGGKGPSAVQFTVEKTICSIQLRPASSEKPQPDYIPDVIKQDYYEACRIRDLSPKASATLARRCMQGMIRDFFGISGKTLYAEIEKLKTQAAAGTLVQVVSPEVLEALDQLKNLGNIGAHMEKDINIIVDVDPGEAQQMLEMIENLFEEWYVARHNRAQKFEKLRSIADSKKELKAPDKLPALPPPQE